MPYMGHVITPEGLKPDPKKISAIKSMPAPSDVKSLKRFLGMVSYLAKFLPSMSQKTEILRSLDRKNTDWNWTKDHQSAFENIKKDICSTPVLKYFDNSKEVTL